MWLLSIFHRINGRLELVEVGSIGAAKGACLSLEASSSGVVAFCWLGLEEYDARVLS